VVGTKENNTFSQKHIVSQTYSLDVLAKAEN